MATVALILGMMGMSLGAMAFLKIEKLEKQLKESGVLDVHSSSE